MNRLPPHSDFSEGYDDGEIRALSRTVIIAGAGIGGLTASLTLAQRGFRAVVLEQATQLEEAGAGIQLSPNATRVLFSLGLGEALMAHAVVPQMMRVRLARSGGELLRVPLGDALTQRMGAPYLAMHRSDLQAVLFDAVRDSPDAVLKLGTRVEDFAVHSNGITVGARRRHEPADEHGIALVAADGLWSTLRHRLGNYDRPRFARRTAWRTVIPASALPAVYSESAINLWFGTNAHLVHYPVKSGRLINIVAIVRDRWNEPGWSAPGESADLLDRLNRRAWAHSAWTLLTAPQRWQRWALFDRRPTQRWGQQAVTLLGDAAHPMLPFLAQGAATAIEDAAVLADCLARSPRQIEAAMRTYEGMRRDRTARCQRTARRHGSYYHRAGVEAVARNTLLRLMGGRHLLSRYDWLYDWSPP